MSTWTLTIADTTQTLDAWGLSSCVLTLCSFAADSFTCLTPINSFSDAALIPHGTEVALYCDGVCMFRGTSHNPHAVFEGHVWRMKIICHNAWWTLDQLVFQQVWTSVDSDTDTEVSADSAEITFGMWYDKVTNADGEEEWVLREIDTAEMLEQIVDYAIDCGVNITRGTILAGIDCPAWTAQDISVAAALKAVCKWHPTAITYWDYTTDAPTLNIALAASLSTSIIDCGSTNLQKLEIEPRYDLQVKGCVVRYKRTKTVEESKVYRSSGISHGHWEAGDNGLMEWVVETVDYEWVLSTYASKHGLTVSATREVDVEYITEYVAGEDGDDTKATTPGVLVYSVDWSSEDVEPPDNAAESIYAESSGLQESGTVELAGAECPTAAIIGTQLALTYGPTLSGTACISGITYDIDAGTTTLDVGPWGALGEDWVDLLARRITAPTDSDDSLTSSTSDSDSSSDDDDESAGIPDGYVEETTWKVYESGLEEVTELVKHSTT